MARCNLVILFFVWLCFVLACSDGSRRPTKIYVPDGYIGWVRIEYDVPGAPSTPRDWFDAWQHEWIPQSGLLQTSSEYGNGVATVKVYYYSASSVRELPREWDGDGLFFGYTYKRVKGRTERFDKEFVTFFVGPPTEAAKHAEELAKLREHERFYVISSLSDLPQVGHLNQTQQH